MTTSPEPASRRWLKRALQQTRWTLVYKVARGRESAAGAGEEFCRAYWYPLYSWLRSSGYGVEDSRDYVQTFLVRLLQEELLLQADPERGLLRNFLITLLRRHIAALRVKAGAARRGGGVTHLPLDWQSAEAAWQSEGAGVMPEDSFRHALAVQLVQEGIAALRERYAGRSGALLEELLPALEGPLPEETYASIGARHGMKPNAVAVAALRMRQRFELEVKAIASRLLGIQSGPGLDAELKEIFCAPVRHLSV